MFSFLLADVELVAVAAVAVRGQVVAAEEQPFGGGAAAAGAFR